MGKEPKTRELPGLAAWLREQIGQRRGAKAEFARRSGLDPAVVTRILNGELAAVRHDVQVRIARGLRLTHRQLLDAVAAGTPAPMNDCYRDVPEAIAGDPDLTTAEKDALLRSYWALRGRGR